MNKKVIAAALFLVPILSCFGGVRHFTFLYEAPTSAAGSLELENWFTWKRNGEEDGDREIVVEVGGGECSEQEEGGVSNGDLSGEADQDVEAEGGNRENADLDRDREPVFAEDLWRKAEQDDAENRKVAGGPGRKDRSVRGVRSAEITGGDHGGASHQMRSMSLVPNRP